MSWLLRLLAALAIGLVSAGGASAHFGGSAYLVVPADFINPGETFEVVAVDLTPNATVSLMISTDDTNVSLGDATADEFGHFTTTLPLPAEFPAGYAQLFATAPDGTSASTWVLVGERTAATPPPPGTTPWWADPSVIVLLVLVGGAIAALAYLLIGPRRKRTPHRS
jgi:hypothetical protein